VFFIVLNFAYRLIRLVKTLKTPGIKMVDKVWRRYFDGSLAANGWFRENGTHAS
jgi:hypothetical protein